MYDTAWKFVKDAKHILLVSHINPDGDTLGSVLALYDAIKRLNKKVSIFNATKELPRIYDFLPNIKKVKNLLPGFYDVVISCDCGGFDRLRIEKGDYTLINIDHHFSNEMFGDINLVNKMSASAGLVVYELLKQNSVKISKDCATCLYVSVVEDTGFFSYSNLNEKTFDYVSELVGYGADAVEIATLLRSRVSLAKTRLLAYMLNNFDLYFDAKVAFVYINREVLAKTGARRYDTKNIVNILRDIVTVKVSMLILEESSGSFKVSLRGKGKSDISLIAKDYGGGGHKNSAGFEVSDCSFEKLKESILQKIKRII